VIIFGFNFRSVILFPSFRQIKLIHYNKIHLVLQGFLDSTGALAYSNNKTYEIQVYDMSVGWIVLIVFILLVLLIAVLLFRTALFKPVEEQVSPAPVKIADQDGAVQRFSRILQKPTVSYRDEDKVDRKPFEELLALLPELYPTVHQHLTREIVAGYSMLYHWKGAESGSPTVLMAHYDVVPAAPEGWEQPPFGGVVNNGIIWGRGSLDTKVTMTAVLEAVEQLLKQGFLPKHDVYLSFGHDEEIGGINGTPSIVALLKERGIEPGMVVDEGGAVVSKLFPGVDKPIAVIGTAEKGRTDLEMTVHSTGGHASTPPADDPAARLAKAINKMHKKPFPAYLSPTTNEMLDTLGRYTPFKLRVIFANLWLFRPLLIHMFLKGGGQTNALCRTTFAVTVLEGSGGANVLPTAVRAVTNIRNAVNETVEWDVGYVRRVIGDDKVELKVLFAAEPSPISDTSSEEYKKLRRAVRETYPEAIVTPYIMLAQSDSRHYSTICKNVFRFTPLSLTQKELNSMHNLNECVPVTKFYKCIEFYLRIIQKL
jgi:carboxypeptidase PM20D1